MRSHGAPYPLSGPLGALDAIEQSSVPSLQLRQSRERPRRRSRFGNGSHGFLGSRAGRGRVRVAWAEDGPCSGPLAHAPIAVEIDGAHPGNTSASRLKLTRHHARNTLSRMRSNSCRQGACRVSAQLEAPAGVQIWMCVMKSGLAL